MGGYYNNINSPYALKYQQPKDKPAKEYFYAYDTTGGRTGPSLKKFTADKIETIENTDTKFEPRYEIEICKSGEPVKDYLLYDPHKQLGGKSRRKKAPVTKGVKYVYKCNYCGKKFIRSKRDSTLKPHKSKNGYNCGGRTAWFIGSKYG